MSPTKRKGRFPARPMKKWLLLAVLFSLTLASCGRLFSPPAVIILAPDVSGDVADASLDQARSMLQARLDDMLKSKARVTVQGSNLRVELSSTTDISPTVQLAKEPGSLIFFDSLESFDHGAPVPEGVEVILTEQDIAQAQNKPGDDIFTVIITFTPQGRQKFAEYTTASIGRCLVIARDGQVILSPRIQEPIRDGQASIYGDLDDASIRSLSAVLNSGRLPFSLKVVEITRR